MLDYDTFPTANWGIRPILFKLGNLEISSYSFFVTLGLVVGLIVFYYLAKKEKEVSENSFYVLIAGIIGGVIGAKIPIWILDFPLIVKSFPDLTPILSGRTITCGFIGGTLAVLYIKRKVKIKDRKGNLFAPAIAIGVAIGRIGCFLRGCCYGIPTNLPWGVNFGDGILRYPTQLFESGFMLILFFYLMYKRPKAKPGYLFYLFMNLYFTFRFFEEFIRAGDRFFGFTVFQYVSVLALLFFNTKYIKERIVGG